MPDLARETVRSPDDPAAHDEPATDARPHTDEQGVVVVAGGAEGPFGPRGRRRVVVHVHGQGERGVQLRFERQVPPDEVGGRQEHARAGVDETRHADPDGHHVVVDHRRDR